MIANIHNAKTNLSKLIERAEAGEEVIIARNGKPAVRLTPVTEENAAGASLPKKRIIGLLEGQIWYAPDYDDADREIQAMFDESINKPFDGVEPLDGK